jgi:hypothetical protein
MSDDIADAMKQQEINDMGGLCMGRASWIYQAERDRTPSKPNARNVRMALKLARETLAYAEETERDYPGAVFKYEGSELYLTEAVKYLRHSIARMERRDQ